MNNHTSGTFIHSSNITGSLTTPAMMLDNTIVAQQLSFNRDAKFDCDVNIKGKLNLNGKDITDILDKIESRLAILHPNIKLEDKWDQLKELGNRYRELEQEIIEKEKMWEILKK